jgi:type IV pilus assembly protein PilC
MLYSYEAFSKSGGTVFGSVEAEKKDDVARILYSQGLIAGKVTPIKSGIKAKVKMDELIIFTRLLSTGVNASIPLTRALEITMSELNPKSPLRFIIVSILHELKAGKALSDALSLYRKIFSELYVNMVRAGERSGKLGQSLEEILKYLQKRYEMRKKISSALLYPGIIMGFAAVILVFFITVLIPKFQESYTQFGSEIPGFTLGLISVTNWIKSNLLYIAGGIVIIWFVIKKLINTQKGRMVYEKFVFGIPVVGELYLKDIVSRFARTLSVLLVNGIVLVDALELVRGIVGNRIFEWTIIRSIKDLSEGKSFTGALKENQYIPNIMLQMSSMGEESGKLPQLMSNIADFYEREVDVSIEKITSVITPVMIMFIGIIIGIIVVGLFLPIFNISQMLG